MPWEKSAAKKPAKSVLNEEAVATVGALHHYKVVEKSPQESIQAGGVEQRWASQATWAKAFASQTNIMHWCDEQSILYMGLDSGIIHRFECPKEKNLLLMKELEEITVHNTMQRVMGLSVDARVNHMFSISESGYLIVTDLNQRSQQTGCKFISSR